MIINPIHPKIFNTNFKSYSSKEYNNGYEYYTTSRFFREDLDWDDLCRFINQKYKNESKVNIICHACSGGEEAYTLALKMISMFDKKAEKFFPIISKDLNAQNIYRARRGIFEVEPAELSRMENNCGINLYKYIDIIDDFYQNRVIKIKDFFKDKFSFSSADILDDTDEFSEDNTVLLCRNFWPYLNPAKQTWLAKQLCKKLKETSIVVLGDFDTSHGINNLLENNGFEKTEIFGVLKKRIKYLA